MSSAVFSTSATLGRPFLFDDEADAQVCLLSGAKKPAGTESELAQAVQSTIKNQRSTIAALGNRQSEIGNLITPASRLRVRPAPEMASSGIPALDALTGGLPRGCLTEICGPASSGRTTVLLAAVAAATRRGEFCVVVDASDALDPQSVAAAGIKLDHLLWVRCGEDSPRRQRGTEKTNRREKFSVSKGLDSGAIAIIGEGTIGQGSASAGPYGCPISRASFAREVGISPQATFNFGTTSCASEHRLEQVLRATDLLLESGGFGLIVLDLADIPPQDARRIPLTTWFRFRRAVENKPTILLAIERQPIAGSCSSLLLQLGVLSSQFSVLSPMDRRHCQRTAPEYMKPCHAHLFTGLEIKVELIRSRLDRKPSRSITLETKTAWAG